MGLALFVATVESELAMAVPEKSCRLMSAFGTVSVFKTRPVREPISSRISLCIPLWDTGASRYIVQFAVCSNKRYLHSSSAA